VALLVAIGGDRALVSLDLDSRARVIVRGIVHADGQPIPDAAGEPARPR